MAITIDFIHVLEYLWKAAWCFYAEGDPAVEAWVQDKARAILAGRAAKVAGAIRRQATNAKPRTDLVATRPATKQRRESAYGLGGEPGGKG